MRAESLIPANDFTAVYETNRNDEAEIYIRLGWHLLETLTTQEGEADYTHYVLGWPGSDAPRFPCANHYIRGASSEGCFCINSNLAPPPRLSASQAYF